MSIAGKYICLSGGEGSGKTTVIDLLRIEYPDAVFVREPGGTPFGSSLRRLLLGRQYAPDPWTELFLLMADRMELYNRIARPALNDGATVISDRCWIETLVYQILTKIGSRAVPLFLDLMRRSGCLMPDLWIWLDIDPPTGLARRQSSGEMNSFDADALELHEKYRQGFGKVAMLLPQMRTIRIDAGQARDVVFAAVKTAIIELPTA